MTIKMTNEEILSHAVALSNAFQDSKQSLPIKINFYLQKNKSTLVALGQELEHTRTGILEQHGATLQDNGQYYIEPAEMPNIQKELNDLFSLEQDVNIYMINNETLPDDVSLTTGQMEAMMFMIE